MSGRGVRTAWIRVLPPVGVGVGVVLAALGWQVHARRRLEGLVAVLEANVARRERGLANSPVPIVVLSPRGVVIRENEAAVELLGRAPSVAEGPDRFLSMLGPDGCPVPLVEAESLRAAPMTLRTAGGDRPVIVYSTPAPSGDGWLLVISDETRQQQLQAELAQAQKREALGQLAAQVAHDFNNLLTPIGGYVELVLTGDGPLADEDRELLGECRRATDRAAALVDKILATSRQQHIGHDTVIEVAAAVRDMSGLLTGVAGPDITADVRVPAGELAVTGIDRTAFEQVLINLVTNARDATPAGGRITVELHDDGRHAVLCVSDTGAGMTPETLGKIFDPFYTTKRDHGGTGLGLATVHAIVESAGGDITVTSQPGRGTTFTLRLPRAEPPPQPTPEQTAAPAPPGDDRLIMVVEDDPQVRTLIRLVLQRHGYRVLSYTCAEQARTDAGDQWDSADLLLTDVVLPGDNGPELARWAHTQAPHLPVIFVSGYAEDELTQQGHAPPGTVLLHKPFQADDLIRVVAAAMHNATATAN